MIGGIGANISSMNLASDMMTSFAEEYNSSHMELKDTNSIPTPMKMSQKNHPETKRVFLDE